MKSFVVALLFAAVAAEDGYTCVDTDPSSWTNVDLSGAAVTDSAGCKAACDTAVTDDAATEDNDWCCSSVADSAASTLACTIWNKATEADADIRADAEDAGTVTSSAWAWVAGVEAESMADIAAAAAAEEEAATEEDDEETEEDEDMSVRMTASAVAAASIAMLAM